MKKIVKYIAIIFFMYLVIMVYMGNTNQYFSYSEIDDDHSGIISLGELLWYSDVITFVRYDNNTNNFLFIIVSLLFPIYSLVSLNIIRINYKYFLRYNGIFLVVVLIFFLRNSFGFESGIDNMIYTKLDIFLFILSLIQLVVTGYFFIYERNVLPNISDE